MDLDVDLAHINAAGNPSANGHDRRECHHDYGFFNGVGGNYA